LEYVKISMVVQENNFPEMPDFVRLGQRLAFDVVYFSQLVNWGTFSDEEFRRRGVHLPGHPRHQEFVAVLQDRIFDEAIVELGNLTDARRSGRRRTQGLRDLWRRVVKVGHG
jgi:hypothetical protein